ncbi:MAG TPA: hypothetical protein VK531_05485 [Gemmatimonadales bacterium]|jgi:hypothetical protein|nr:hypothetical protein [Gemmatimonadales bacterium]
MKPDRLSLAALLVAATAAALSCADPGITGPPRPDATAPAWLGAPVLQASATSKKGGGGGGGGNGGVASCSTVQVGMIRQTVGPAGGVVALGPARLTIPAGALSAPVTIQAQIPAGYSGNYIQFKPDKVVFKQPASLTISYSNCSLANATQLKVAQVSDVLQIIQYVPSTNDLDAHTVTGQLQHFSNYAVAW